MGIVSDVSTAPRLPTRCPNCKGAVIQRMAGRSHGGFTWFHCFFCNHTWKCRLDDARADLNGELAGDVFVVTTSGRRHALGAVALSAIPEDALKEHLDRKTALRELESGKLRRRIDSVAATLERVRAEEDRLWKIRKQDENNLRKSSAWSVAYNKMKNLTKEIDDLVTRLQDLTSGEHFFQDLPSPISSAKTHADGKFALVIPRYGRYGIVARASREQGEKKETYFWFVWITLGGLPLKRVVLNNDNIVGAGSPDSALR